MAVVSEVVSDRDNWQERSVAFIEDNECTGIQPEYGDFDFYRRRNSMCRSLIYFTRQTYGGLITFVLVLGLLATNVTFGLTFDIRIAADMDDVEQHLSNGDIDPTSTDLELAYEDAGNPATDEQIVGLRFVNILIPQGTQVTGAYVEFEVDAVDKEGSSYPVNLIIEGELTPNATPFLDATNNITNRPLWTTAKVKWSIPAWTATNVKWRTPDISPIIQEIVNQNGWAGGNALILIFRDDKSNPSKGLREAEAFEGEAPAAPLLHLEIVNLVATQPDPPDGAPNVTTPVFEWTPGDTAKFHDVYFGTNPTPGPAEFKDRRTYAKYFHADGLIPRTTYYWRIDEVDADGTTTHTGSVWSFTAAPLKAYDPDPPDGVKCVTADVTLAWSPGATAITHDVYFGTDKAVVTDGTGGTFKVNQPGRTFSPGTLLKDTAYYWRINEVEADKTTKHTGDVWSFKTLPDITISDPNLVGWWKLDEGYGSTVYDWSGHGNNGILGGNPKWVAGVIDGALDLDGSDYVVIDSVADDITGTNITLSVWIKMTQGSEGNVLAANDSASAHPLMFGVAGGNPYVYDGSAIQFPPAVNDGQWHMLTYVRNGSTGSVYVDGVQQGTYSAAFDLATVTRWSIGQEWDDGTPSDFYRGMVDDVRIYKVPLRQAQIAELIRGDPLLAWRPKPADKSTPDVEKATPLGWTPGDKAAQHDVYFGTDQTAVANATTASTGIYRGRQVAASYTPAEALQWGGGPYYWRIDEYNTDGTVSTGKVWSFTIADYLIVDDFEDYTDDVGSRIFQTWLDGWGYNEPAPGYPGNGTGSAVGYLDAPYAETSIFHGGSQAMPFWYDNTGATGKARYSETVREFATAQDWTRDGVKSLTLWFRGLPAVVGSYSYNAATGIHTMTGSGADIWDVTTPRQTGFHDEFHFAYKRLSGAGTITAKVVSVSNTDAWAKAGVMIRQTLDGDSVHTMTVVTPGSGVSFQRRPTTGAASADTTVAGVTAPQWVKLELTLSGQFIASYSANGTSWTPIGSPESISMQGDVYIGLALTSHNAAATCIAEFSDVTTTGSVTGQWQSQDIGIASNLADTLYMAVQDASNESAAVPHPDPNAVLKGSWQAWDVDLAQFTGVNLKAIKKVFLGVGNRTAPKTGGSGTLYFDDIELYRPRCKADLARPALSLNNDCVVDMKDLQVLANDWLVGPDSSGLQYEYYEADWDLLPDFDAVLPAMAGSVSNFDITVRLRDDYFGFRFSGQIKVATAGSYTFYTTSDDGSQLYIGNTLVVDNDGLHGMVEQSGTISLTAGMHPITVTMFEKGGGEGLVVEYQGPGVTRQEIPDGVLYRLSSVADVHPDGSVDFKDYAVLVDSWLDEVLWP